MVLSSATEMLFRMWRPCLIFLPQKPALVDLLLNFYKGLLKKTVNYAVDRIRVRMKTKPVLFP